MKRRCTNWNLFLRGMKSHWMILNEGSIKEVTMHDGSVIVFKKLGREYDPTNRTEAIKMLEEAIRKNWLITGLIYVDPDSPNIYDMYPMGKNRLIDYLQKEIRPRQEITGNY